MTSVLASPAALPGFWIFMYRVSPFTYLVSAVLSVGLSGNEVTCSDYEILHIPPPHGQTCGDYMGAFAEQAHIGLLTPNSTTDCEICTMSTTDQFLAQLSISFDDRWRNVGLLFVYVAFNAVAAVFLYWLIRVPKKSTLKAKKE